MAPKRPFVVWGNLNQPFISEQASTYDPVEEGRIQIAQAINGYLMVWISRGQRGYGWQKNIELLGDQMKSCSILNSPNKTEVISEKSYMDECNRNIYIQGVDQVICYLMVDLRWIEQNIFSFHYLPFTYSYTNISIRQYNPNCQQISLTYESMKLAWSFSHYHNECPAYAYLSIGFFTLNLIWAASSYFGFKSIWWVSWKGQQEYLLVLVKLTVPNTNQFYLITDQAYRNIRIFSYMVSLNFLLRLGIYIACGVVMKGFVPNYIELTDKQINSKEGQGNKLKGVKGTESKQKFTLELFYQLPLLIICTDQPITLDIVCAAIYPQSLFILEGVFEGVVGLVMMFLTNSIYNYVLRWEKEELIKRMPRQLETYQD